MNLLCRMGAHQWDANHCPRCGEDNPDPRPFRSVAIGDQVWMAEDLTVGRFRNGDPIPEARSIEEFRETGKKGLPAWQRMTGGKHVREYNWFAVNDERGLAPPGWRIPSVMDFEALFRAVDRQDLVAKDQGGTNASGFSGLTAFEYWTATRRWFNPPTSFSFGLRGSDGAITKTTREQSEGCLVRCVREK
jgi:uncharacterized protein (TIGR02145 family)